MSVVGTGHGPGPIPTPTGPQYRDGLNMVIDVIYERHRELGSEFDRTPRRFGFWRRRHYEIVAAQEQLTILARTIRDELDKKAVANFNKEGAQ